MNATSDATAMGRAEKERSRLARRGADETDSGQQFISSGAEEIRILLAEGTVMMLDALHTLLHMHSGLCVAAALTAGDEVVDAAAATDPRVAVIDIDLAGIDGIAAAARLHAASPTCKILIFASCAKPSDLRSALEAGATGFVMKDVRVGYLVEAIQRVARGEQVIDSRLAAASLRAPSNPLSRREAEVLLRYAEGDEPHDIARELRLSSGTVRNYLASAVRKVNARNRVHAIRVALDAGWL